MGQSEYGRKGINGARKGPGAAKTVRNPLKGKPMKRGPKEVKPSLKGYVPS